MNEIKEIAASKSVLSAISGEGLTPGAAIEYNVADLYDFVKQRERSERS